MDFETGGLNHRKDPRYKERQGHPNSRYYPITEFAAIVLRGDDLSEIIRYDNLIAPYDDQLEYSQGAADVTGITKEKVEIEGVQLDEFMNDFKTLCVEAAEPTSKNQKPVLVGHNLGFDVDFLLDVANRTGTDLSKYIDGYINDKGDFIPRFIDTELFSVQKWGKDPNKKSYTLTNSSNYADIDIIGAHRAMSDVIANVDLFRYLINSLRSEGVEAVSNKNKTIRKKFPISVV